MPDPNKPESNVPTADNNTTNTDKIAIEEIQKEVGGLKEFFTNLFKKDNKNVDDDNNKVVPPVPPSPTVEPDKNNDSEQINLLKTELEEQKKLNKELADKFENFTTDKEKADIEKEINKLKKDGVIGTDDAEAVKH